LRMQRKSYLGIQLHTRRHAHNPQIPRPKDQKSNNTHPNHNRLQKRRHQPFLELRLQRLRKDANGGLKMTIEEMWDYLVDTGIVTKEELIRIITINGYNKQSLKDVLYARTGYRDFDQIQEEI
jgi:hypothetical protein